jgi:hypothetical protein
LRRIRPDAPVFGADLALDHATRRLPLRKAWPADGKPMHLIKGVKRDMGKRDDLIAHYADDLKNKCGMEPDMALLTKVTIGCGPAIYDADASTVAGTQPGEVETVKKNFLIKKLGLKDGPELDAAIASVLETYGKSERNKYRAVVYYMLTKHFGKEAVYG